jgi:prepilin-type processing-associated H-X9-DG protein
MTCLFGHRSLREMDIALQVYADNNRHEYPIFSGAEGETEEGLNWFDSLYAPRRTGDETIVYSQWTDLKYQCPTYLAEGCGVWAGDEPDYRFGSYSYNWFGTGNAGVPGEAFLGIGENGTLLSSPAGPVMMTAPAHDFQVVAPGELFVCTDSRPANYTGGVAFTAPQYGINVTFPPNTSFGHDYMFMLALSVQGGGYLNEAGSQELPSPHVGGYNIAFADGHVAPISRRDYLYPPVAASHWNRDNMAHTETWSGPSLWAVQK